MTQYLPPNLLALFAPRDPLPYLPPLDTLPTEKKPWPYSGVSQYLRLFEDPSETPAATRGETKEERVARKVIFHAVAVGSQDSMSLARRQEREDRHREALESKIGEWDPNSDANIDGDPFKTLFVGRINYDTSESKLRREFEQYGPIKRIQMVTNQKTGKPCGYAFIVYEKERDMHAAYKHADGKKIDSKRVVVDVERGRTVKSWRPRRLGGGLGGTRRGAPHENIKYSGRVDERDMDHNEREQDRDRNRDRDRDRDRDRERDRERDRDRDRERDRERRHERSHDRDRERDRGDRRRRSRSRDKERDSRDKERRKRSHSRERNRDRERSDRDRDSGRRDRSRSRDRKERRDKEKSRDKDRDREKERDRSSRRDKDKDREKERGGRKQDAEESVNGAPPMES